MTAVRRAGALAAVSALTTLAGVLPARPAAAHGTTTDPVSRSAACADGGSATASAACRAARAATGGAFGAFDNLRVAGVDGRDRQVVPDGRLCSAGLPGFAGLDLARDDWPATRVTAGRPIEIRYRGTIPHRGTFRLYLTEPGYDPDRPLRWDDLGGAPWLTVTDPPLRGGAYRMRGKLPADREGRHVLYVVWQNSSTPDTYYSCSDLIVKAAATAAAAPAGTAARRGESAPPSPDVPVGGPVELQGVAVDIVTPPGRQFAGVTLIVLAAVAATLAVVRMRRARNAGTNRGR